MSQLRAPQPLQILLAWPDAPAHVLRSSLVEARLPIEITAIRPSALNQYLVEPGYYHVLYISPTERQTITLVTRQQITSKVSLIVLGPEPLAEFEIPHLSACLYARESRELGEMVALFIDLHRWLAEGLSLTQCVEHSQQVLGFVGNEACWPAPATLPTILTNTRFGGVEQITEIGTVNVKGDMVRGDKIVNIGKIIHEHVGGPASHADKNKAGNTLIVTVTKVEAKAVLDVFAQASGVPWTRKTIGNKIYYDLAVHGGAPVFMVQSEMGIATPGGALLTVRQAIQDLAPQAVILCGIAFGLQPDQQQLGDILVAKQLVYYEPQKIDHTRGQIPRGDRLAASERLLVRFRSGDNDWQGSRTHFGLVLSGEKLANDSAFRDWLLEIEPEAIGGEMEGAGLYAATRDTKVDWILVKAICDWADGSKNNEAQALAALNAARFVLHVLQLGD